MFCDSNSFWSGIWVETLFENILFKTISPRRTDRHGVVLSGATCTSAIATAERERQEYPGRPNQKVSNRLHENKRQIFKGAEKTNVFMLLISRPCGNQNFESALVPIDLSHKPWDPLGARCIAWSRLPSRPQAGWEGSWAELKVWDEDVKISLVFNHKKENTIGFQTCMTSCGCHGMAVDCMVMSTLILYNRVVPTTKQICNVYFNPNMHCFTTKIVVHTGAVIPGCLLAWCRMVSRCQKNRMETTCWILR